MHAEQSLQLMRGPLGRREEFQVLRPSLWFGIGETGGLELEVTYKTGTGSSRDHLPTLNPVLVGALGCSRPELFKGSLNLWADEPVALPSPASLEIGAFTWHFVPIVLEPERSGGCRSSLGLW